VNPPDRAASETAVHDMVSSISPAMTFGPRIKPRKAARAAECDTFEQLPNVGPAMAGDLRAIGLVHPRELAHRDPFVLYQALCAHTGRRQDPCVLDTFMAITDFMRGAAPAPWWTYTAQRKVLYGSV
jgi:hypothetical protein